MPYFNQLKILTDKNLDGMTWYTDVECDLVPKDGNVIVFDEILGQWTYQPVDDLSWKYYLIKIGVNKLLPNEKVVNGQVVNKDLDEMLADGSLSKEKYNQIKVAEIDSLLSQIDAKKTRAITDYILTGDKTRLELLEAEAIILRQQRGNYA